MNGERPLARLNALAFEVLDLDREDARQLGKFPPTSRRPEGPLALMAY
jgi:hypothetical protein